MARNIKLTAEGRRNAMYVFGLFVAVPTLYFVIKAIMEAKKMEDAADESKDL
tara:strand:- start:485 stop:640 length:156 start_codon:yes stop_codon:yes gene_type:complete